MQIIMFNSSLSYQVCCESSVATGKHVVSSLLNKVCHAITSGKKVTGYQVLLSLIVFPLVIKSFTHVYDCVSLRQFILQSMKMHLILAMLLL